MTKITFRALRNERASVFISGLILVVVMTLLAGALFDLSLLGSRMFQDSASTAQALYCVEAGGARALAEIVPAPDDPLSWDGVPQNLPTPTGNCEYVATYGNTADPKILIATGTLGSVSRTLKWTAESSGVGGIAILIGGDLQISGNPPIAGTCGNVHANADLSIPGSPTIAGDATASGTYSASGNPIIGGESGGGKPLILLPTIDPFDFLAAAKASLPANEVFQMMSDGQVLDGKDVLITTLGAGEEFRGWVYNRQNKPWDYGADIAFDGTYYLEGDAVVSGNPGTTTTQWTSTIITTESIEISGEIIIGNHLTDVLLVAGLDIKIGGNPLQRFSGIITAHEQIDVSGNPAINGYFYGEDAASSGHLVTENKISGNLDITYNCEFYPPEGLTWTWGECADPSCGT